MRARILILLPVIALAGCRPVLREALGVREIEPAALEALLRGSAPPLVLDVRGEPCPAGGFIPGARAVSEEEIPGYLARHGPPRDRMVVTVCARGVRSLQTAVIVAAEGWPEARSLRGGMERWAAEGRAVSLFPAERPEEGPIEPPRLTVSTFTQVVTVVTAFGVKPFYMLLALVLAILLRRRVEPDLRVLRWSLVTFFLGEFFCALNYIFTLGLCDPLEVAHQAGMVAFATLLPWGLFLFVDRRLARFSAPDAACFAMRLCGTCWKREAVSCPAHRVFLFAAPVLAVLALAPFAAPLDPVAVTIPILETDVLYRTDVLVELLEFRLYPVLAAARLLVSFALLLRGRSGIKAAQLPFFLGFGFFAFAVPRFFLVMSYRPVRPWSDAWEELTELAVVLFLALFLWVFRRSFGLSPRPGPA